MTCILCSSAQTPSPSGIQDLCLRLVSIDTQCGYTCNSIQVFGDARAIECEMLRQQFLPVFGDGRHLRKIGRALVVDPVPHLLGTERLEAELGLNTFTNEVLATMFASRTASEWENWAKTRDLPIVVVQK